MTMLELVKHLNFAVVVLFTLLYLYQGFYVVVGLVRRRWQDRHQPSRLHRFAVIVSARNEEGVIGELLESLNRQNYPKELLDLYVVADNCTDDTAGVARRVARSCTSDSTRYIRARATPWTTSSAASKRREGLL
ncbi:glycosyltransferase [Flavonifractor plautii]|nr:glycosyltransferase [Flavonifractor plautii]